jgi:hypothetical protein
MGNIRTFLQLQAEHDRLSDKLFFLNLGYIGQSDSFVSIIETGEIISESDHYLMQHIEEVRKVKAKLDEIGSRIGG